MPSITSIPLARAQHQKMVVIDDAVAFVGGIDFSAGRLDTRRHDPHDDGRRDSNGEIPQPHHDIQIAVSGKAARAIGEIARERWEVATGEVLEAPPADLENPWPKQLEPDFCNQTVAIARTRAAWKDLPELREIEALYLSSIAAARKTIYAENQYVTSVRIGEALAERLCAEVSRRSGGRGVWILPCAASRLDRADCHGHEPAAAAAMLRRG